jgi:hypothetical protein
LFKVWFSLMNVGNLLYASIFFKTLALKFKGTDSEPQ